MDILSLCGCGCVCVCVCVFVLHAHGIFHSHIAFRVLLGTAYSSSTTYECVCVCVCVCVVCCLCEPDPAYVNITQQWMAAIQYLLCCKGRGGLQRCSLSLKYLLVADSHWLNLLSKAHSCDPHAQWLRCQGPCLYHGAWAHVRNYMEIVKRLITVESRINIAPTSCKTQFVFECLWKGKKVFL